MSLGTAAVAVLCALPPVFMVFLSPRAALLCFGVFSGVVALAVLLVFFGRRWVDTLYLSFLALVSIPVDRYLAFREHVGGWPGLRVSVADLLLIALLPTLALGLWSGRARWRLLWPLVLIYGLWLVQYGISALGAPRQDLAAFEMASALHALLLAVCAAALFRRSFLTPVLVVLALQVVLHTVFAWAQVATGRPLGAGLGSGPAGVVLESFETGTQRLRPSGLFDHPIVYADFLLLCLPVLGASLYGTRARRLRFGFATALGIGLSGLVLTLSRGAWISSLVSAAVLLWLARRKGLLDGLVLRRTLAVSASVLGLTACLFGPLIVQRLTASMKGNLQVRFELNEIALRMVAAHPVKGVGVSNFIPAMPRYDTENVMEYFPAVVHNLYLLEASEAGIPGLLLFLGLWGVLFATAGRTLTKLEDPALAWFAVAIMAVLCGFLVSQLTDFSHRLEPLRSVLWVLVGLLFGALQTGTPGLAPQEGEP